MNSNRGLVEERQNKCQGCSLPNDGELKSGRKLGYSSLIQFALFSSDLEYLKISLAFLLRGIDVPMDILGAQKCSVVHVFALCALL
jgi:hypothetical protein